MIIHPHQIEIFAFQGPDHHHSTARKQAVYGWKRRAAVAQMLARKLQLPHFLESVVKTWTFRHADLHIHAVIPISSPVLFTSWLVISDMPTFHPWAGRSVTITKLLLWNGNWNHQPLSVLLHLALAMPRIAAGRLQACPRVGQQRQTISPGGAMLGRVVLQNGFHGAYPQPQVTNLMSLIGKIIKQ